MTQRASLAILQGPCAFLIVIWPLFVFADSSREAYDIAQEGRWGFWSILISAGTTVSFNWRRSSAPMCPAAYMHTAKPAT